jgi:hypothetical protein
MDEKPKSIWKKSITGRRAWLIWLAVAVFTVMLGSFISALLDFERPMSEMPLTVGIFTGVFLAIILFLIYVVWPLLRWLFWKHWRPTLFGLACFATLIALFYAEEDWRGKHDWEKYKREWEAKGERFDWQSIVPPPVPDDQNFAFSPVWIAEEKYNFLYEPKRAEAWYGNQIYSEQVSKIVSQLPVSVSGLVGTNWWSHRGLPNAPEVTGNWTTAHVTDLKPWQSYYRDLGKNYPATEIPVTPQPQTPAQDVLLALSKFDPVIEQLRQDSARPDSRFPIQYDDADKDAILLPHLAAEHRYAQVLQLRAIAELKNGENEKALDDVKLMMRLTDASRTEPFLICQLVRIGILNLTLQPIWEGLAEHKWSDAQLSDLDSELAKLDFLAAYKLSIRGERALKVGEVDYLQRAHNKVHEFSAISGERDNSQINFSTVALVFGPSGWYDQNKIRFCRFFTRWYLPIVDDERKLVFPNAVKSADAAFEPEVNHRTPENVLETWWLPDLSNAVKKFAHAQSSTELARVAIALERYRLAHGNFPDSLDTLVPQFIEKIPHDVIGGQPLHYRRTDDGQFVLYFVLYSVGWNATDDGGVVVFKKGSTPDVDISEGDWVWKYPQK